MRFSDYALFCALVFDASELLSDYDGRKLESERNVVDRLYYLEFMRLNKRLSKADTYPLGTQFYKKDKVTISLEPQEALVVWFWITLNDDKLNNPLISLLKLHLHKILL